MIGIDGHSAAGKSTLATALAIEFDHVAVVHGDDFYRIMSGDQRAGLDPAQGADLYYDWQLLRDEVLLPLRGGCRATFRPYDWGTNQLSDTVVTIEPAPVIVVEGLFVSRPELESLIDLSVLVSVDPASRERRQRNRADASPAWLQRWEAAEQWYFRNVRPPGSFDIVLSGK
ncbi:MAG: hypothetical protein QM650_01570 [Microlunatus sp.]